VQVAGRRRVFEAWKAFRDMDGHLAVAGVANAVLIRIGLIGVGDVGAVVVFIEQTVSIIIVWADRKIVVAGVPDPVVVAVQLVLIGKGGAVVGGVGNRVLVAVLGRGTCRGYGRGIRRRCRRCKRCRLG